MKVEDLRLGASVLSHDGHKLGSLSRFVFNTDTFKLTHIVIDTGILRSGESLWKGGWGLPHDRIVPLAAIEREDSHEVHLTMTAEEFRDHSRDFSDEYFTQIPDERPGWPDASDLARVATSIPGEPGPYLMRETVALAPHEADVPDDAPVWRLKPHQKIGEVERVIYDEASGKITGLVIRRGHIFTKDVVLPVDHVVEVVAGIVRVDLDDDALNALFEFHPAD